MYIVNTTYIVEPAVDAQWREWVAVQLLPQLDNPRVVLTRVLSQEPTEHQSYSLQIEAIDVPQMQIVRQITAQPIPFGQAVLAFTTVLKKIEL